MNCYRVLRDQVALNPKFRIAESLVMSNLNHETFRAFSNNLGLQMKTAESRPPSWQIVLAFAIIYLVWGSTFLAIRVGVHEVPPLLLAAMRFVAAGVAMYLWLRWKGTATPSRREWLAASFLGFLIFVLDYGCLFWAEQRVPSGIAAVILATIPVFMTLSEIIFLRTQRLTARLGTALLVGLFGVAILMNNSLSLGEAPVDRAGANCAAH